MFFMLWKLASLFWLTVFVGSLASFLANFLRTVAAWLYISWILKRDYLTLHIGICLFRNHVLVLSLLLCARQSLWFESIVSNCVLSEALGRYPTISASGLPPQKNFRVGNPWTPYRDAISGACSTFNLTNANRPRNSLESESKSGNSRLHQGHQGAQKSTITGTADWSTSLSQLAESASTTISLQSYLFILLLVKLADKLLVYEFSEGGVKPWFHFFFFPEFFYRPVLKRVFHPLQPTCPFVIAENLPLSHMVDVGTDELNVVRERQLWT